MILCADDYGISPAVSAGILELVEEGRLSAVSCMMLGPHIEQTMANLRSVKCKIDIGLHLVLTDDCPLTPLESKSGLVDMHGNLLSFPKLFINAYRRKIDYGDVLREIEAQIKRFETLMGRSPDFIDGHRHVHQLPAIRKAVNHALRKLIENQQNIYVRVAKLPLRWLWTKGLFHSWKFALGNSIISLPGKPTALLMSQDGIPCNRFLLGFHDYERESQFESVFQRYMTLQPGPRDIFFCHPGYVDDELRRRDPLVSSRVAVLKFLRSPRFPMMLNESGVALNTFFDS